MTSKPCPFRTLPENRIADYKDGFAVSPGHTLIIPRRHVGLFCELNENEQQAMPALLTTTKTRLDHAHSPDSYNIGINDGLQAGQTTTHVQLHLIPRYQSDVKDPRCGVRWPIPDKADHWTDRSDKLDG